MIGSLSLSSVHVLETLLKSPLRLYKTSVSDWCLLAFSRSGVSGGMLVAHGEMHKKTEVAPLYWRRRRQHGRVAASTQKRMSEEEQRAPRTNVQPHCCCKVIKVMGRNVA